MPLSEILGRFLGGGSGNIEVRAFDCNECGHSFESAKRPERAQCMECLSSDLEVVGTAERR